MSLGVPVVPVRLNPVRPNKGPLVPYYDVGTTWDALGSVYHTGLGRSWYKSGLVGPILLVLTTSLSRVES